MAKPCLQCPSDPPEPKDGSHPRWCIECRYLRMTADEQIAAARTRLAAVPPPLRRSTVPAKHWPPGRRWCAGCQSFVRVADLRGKKTKATRCRACQGESTRDGYVRRVYDITGAEEEALWLSQDRRCAICHRPVWSKRPAVDHDHVTLEVRGLLCAGERGCNVLLGLVEGAAKNDRAESLAILDRARAYLASPPAPPLLAAMRDGTYRPPAPTPAPF